MSRPGMTATTNEAGESTVLEETIDENYEPTSFGTPTGKVR